jgi:hypothetical protein
MGLIYTPKSKEEIIESSKWPSGVYPFTVSQAHESISSARNEMIVVRLVLSRPDGGRKIMTDYLVTKKLGKIEAICSSCGLTDKYLSGRLSAADFIGRSGKLKLRVQRPKDGYPSRNEIAGYI